MVTRTEETQEVIEAAPKPEEKVMEVVIDNTLINNKLNYIISLLEKR